VAPAVQQAVCPRLGDDELGLCGLLDAPELKRRAGPGRLRRARFSAAIAGRVRLTSRIPRACGVRLVAGLE
jgi:hypothetical protein